MSDLLTSSYQLTTKILGFFESKERQIPVYDESPSLTTSVYQNLEAIARILGIVPGPQRPMATKLFEIGTDSRDYSTVTSWKDDLDGVAYTTGDDAVGECYADSDFSSEGTLTITGGTTSGLNSVTLTAATSDRHTGVANTGVRFLMSGSILLSVPSGFDNKYTFEFIEVDFQGGAFKFSAVTSSAGNVGILQNCIIHDSTVATAMIEANTRDLLVRNNIVYDYTRTSGDIRGIYLDADRTSGGCFNNTVYGIVADSGTAYGIRINTNSANGSCKNNLSMGVNGSTAGFAFSFGGTATDSDYNLSDDDTSDDGGGANNIINATDTNQFVSIASRDFHLISGADAIDSGIGPGADADIPTGDIDGDVRSGATCDIGADEFISAGGGSAALLASPILKFLPNLRR